VSVQRGDQTRAIIAQGVEGEERARLWARTAREYPAYADYQQKTDRKIPVVDVSVKVLSRIEVKHPQS